MVDKMLCRAVNYGYVRSDCKDNFYLKNTKRNALDDEFVHWNNSKDFNNTSKAKIGSHDTGQYTGFFFGGFGTASFSRGATGFFDRWQLRQGVPITFAMDNAYIAIRWVSDGNVVSKKLRVSSDGFSTYEMSSFALFPVTYEKYDKQDMPFDIILEGYSPVIPHNLTDSILPVTLFNVYVIPKTEEKMEVSIMLCFPNILGWKPTYRSTELKCENLWPTHENSGNFAKLAENTTEKVSILQSRNIIGERDDLCGDVMLAMECKGWQSSYATMFKETKATTGFDNKDQLYTIGKIKYDFDNKGILDNTSESWEAHWHEPTASALCANTILCGEKKKITFSITMELPITKFGMGRKWYKLYTENHNLCKAKDISDYAISKNNNWLTCINDFHELALNGSDGLSKKILGAKINELYFVTSGGSVLVSRPVEGWNEENALLGKHPHYGLLEGFDTGYYYYNTLDLWVYGFLALSKHWSEIAEWVFADYIESTNLIIDRKNMIYRDGILMDNLVFGKLPHDVGSCAEDLFVRINGYNFRDTPNMWKDHNPAFIIAFYLHKITSELEISSYQYKILKDIMRFTINQDNENLGIPLHNEFGDSTWDNLNMQGISTYCGCLCIGAYAVMIELANKFNDSDISFYREKLIISQKNIDKLWNGKYYVTSELGKYKNATMADALFGIMLAKKAGIKDLLPIEKIKSHLLNTYKNNFLNFSNGKYGALLVAEPNIQKYERDGGDEMQVNEVIVGSSWILASCLKEFGFYQEAEKLSNTMVDLINEYSLQFRTPAAWNSIGQFRAPMNMRPLAIWLL